MKKNALISVILPAFNSEKFIENSIKSILMQSYKNFELLIIYDISKDKTLEIIKKFKDKRIKIIFSQNKGLPFALNLGLKKAKGAYIARMDADDISGFSRLEEQINFLKTKNADICGCNYQIINSQGKDIAKVIVPKLKRELDLCIIFNPPFAHGSVMFKKNPQIKYDTNDDIAEDYILWLKLYEKGVKFVNLNKYLYFYRINENGLSKINRYKLIIRSYSESKSFIISNKEKYKKIIRNIKIYKLSRKYQINFWLLYFVLRKIIKVSITDLNYNFIIKFYAYIKFLRLEILQKTK